MKNAYGQPIPTEKVDEKAKKPALPKAGEPESGMRDGGCVREIADSQALSVNTTKETASSTQVSSTGNTQDI